MINNMVRKQRGAAALAVAMVLLFGMTVVAFFANRGMIFEQRTSANQVRYTKGFELADAGLEWAIARINDTQTLPAYAAPTATSTAAAYRNCEAAAAPGATLLSFRDRYIRPMPADATHATGWFNPLTTAYVGCQVNPVTGAKTCDCPSAAGTGVLLVPTDQASSAYAAGTTTFPRFRVQFNPTADIQAVEIVSRGCTAGDPCDPAQPATSSDSSTIVRAIVKLRPTFPNLPGAGLIAGSTTLIGGSVNVINTDTASNGITINTGSTVEVNANGFTVQSLPGTPPAQSILDNDPSLLKLTNADASGELFFSSFMGQGFAAYKGDLDTKVLSPGAGGSNAAYEAGTCSDASDCAKAVSYWADRGSTKFWVNGAADFGANTMPSNTSTLGTAGKPIALVTTGNLSFGSNVTAYGIFYAATASVNTDATLGNGNPTIIGSFISRGDISKQGTGNLTVAYDGKLFGQKGPPTGILVPVPGSWRDKATAF